MSGVKDQAAAGSKGNGEDHLLDARDLRTALASSLCDVILA
jgi:hypothetical protein